MHYLHHSWGKGVDTLKSTSFLHSVGSIDIEEVDSVASEMGTPGPDLQRQRLRTINPLIGFDASCAECWASVQVVVGVFLVG